MAQLFILFAFIFLWSTPVRAEGDNVYDHEVETMWGDIARNVSPISTIQQSILRTEPLYWSRRLSTETISKLFDERKRLLVEELPAWLNRQRHDAIIILEFEEAANSSNQDLLALISWGKDAIFNHLAGRLDTADTMAYCAYLEAKFSQKIGLKVQQLTPRNYGRTVNEQKSVLTSYISSPFLKGQELDPTDAQFGETIIGISKVNALQVYALILDNSFSEKLEPILVSRMYSILVSEPELARELAKDGTFLNRIRALISNDAKYRCQLVLWKIARTVGKNTTKN